MPPVFCKNSLTNFVFCAIILRMKMIKEYGLILLPLFLFCLVVYATCSRNQEKYMANERYVQKMSSEYAYTVQYYLPDRYATVQLHYTNKYELVGTDGVKFINQNGNETLLKGTIKIIKNH